MSSEQMMKNKTNLSQRYFNPLFMPLYDFFVYRFVSQYIWGCSGEALINRYKQHIGRNHLEVGVGTGYLVDKCNAAPLNLDLMDLSQTCLQKSSHRLARYSPKLIRHNILERPIEEDKRYDSIGINYVMHCVAGDFKDKGIVFGNLKKLLKSKGIIFGATVLPTKQSSRRANIFIKLLNGIGVFNNINDSDDALKQVLSQHFRYVCISIEAKSSVALFTVSDEPCEEIQVLRK